MQSGSQREDTALRAPSPRPSSGTGRAGAGDAPRGRARASANARLPQRHIQDPASQRLTWSKSPKSVLVIKKIRDASLLQPFKELCVYLMEVSRGDRGVGVRAGSRPGFQGSDPGAAQVRRLRNPASPSLQQLSSVWSEKTVALCPRDRAAAAHPPPSIVQGPARQEGGFLKTGPP